MSNSFALSSAANSFYPGFFPDLFRSSNMKIFLVEGLKSICVCTGAHSFARASTNSFATMPEKLENTCRYIAAMAYVNTYTDPAVECDFGMEARWAEAFLLRSVFVCTNASDLEQLHLIQS